MDHFEGAGGAFGLALGEEGEVGDFGTDEEHGAGVWASGHAGATADAGGGFHGDIGVDFADGEAIAVGGGAIASGDEAAGLLDAIEGRAIHDEVADDGEGLGAEGFHVDGGAIGELAHVELAGGGLAGAVGDAIDGEGAGAADAFAAIVIEGDGFLAFAGEVIVDDVEHFEEGSVFGDIASFDIGEGPWGGGIFLAPDFEFEVHWQGAEKDYL